jgi:hypothetical protein
MDAWLSESEMTASYLELKVKKKTSSVKIPSNNPPLASKQEGNKIESSVEWNLEIFASNSL